MRDSFLTKHASRFHQGNNAEDIQQETTIAITITITHLANATMDDREGMASLSATVTSLTVQLAKSTLKLAEAIYKSCALQVKVTGLKAKNNGRRGGNYGKGGDKKPVVVTFENYFWTHGIKCEHSSQQCTRRAN